MITVQRLLESAEPHFTIPQEDKERIIAKIKVDLSSPLDHLSLGILSSLALQIVKLHSSRQSDPYEQKNIIINRTFSVIHVTYIQSPEEIGRVERVVASLWKKQQEFAHTLQARLDNEKHRMSCYDMYIEEELQLLSIETLEKT